MAKINLIDVLKLVLSLVICQIAGLVGSIFTMPAIPIWYDTLDKPFFTPPNWIFAPVWSLLFTIIGISAFLIWRTGSKEKNVRNALGIFIIQLLLNILWSFLFFGLRSPLAGFIEIIVLWFAILLTIVKFYKISKLAGFLLLPYILWVSFALVLNFYLWRLNI